MPTSGWPKRLVASLLAAHLVTAESALAQSPAREIPMGRNSPLILSDKQYLARDPSNPDFRRPPDTTLNCKEYLGRDEYCIRGDTRELWACWITPVVLLNYRCLDWDAEEIQKDCRIWTEGARMYGDLTRRQQFNSGKSRFRFGGAGPPFAQTIPPTTTCLLRK